MAARTVNESSCRGAVMGRKPDPEVPGKRVARSGIDSLLRPLMREMPVVRRRAGDQGVEYLARKVLSNKLFDSYELEKKRIARDLHDGVGQILTNINLRIGQCVATVQELNDPKLRAEAEKFLESIPPMVSEAIDEVRQVCMSIRPSELDDLGVLQAINWQCRRFAESAGSVQIGVDFSAEEADIPEGLKTPIYRIAQEALHNAVKHTHARTICVRLVKADGVLSLGIEDDGEGFDCQQQLAGQALPGKTGIGLSSMKERGEALGGNFAIISSRGIGTAVCVSWLLRG